MIGRRRSGFAPHIRSHRTALVLVAALLATAGAVNIAPRPAGAASPIAITVSSSPTPVYTGQALAYSINVVNKGAATATGASITNSLQGVGPGNLGTAPAMSANVGSCRYNAGASQVTCTAASLAPGQVWTIAITSGRRL